MKIELPLAKKGNWNKIRACQKWAAGFSGLFGSIVN
jgi:hypothetical protein